MIDRTRNYYLKSHSDLHYKEPLSWFTLSQYFRQFRLRSLGNFSLHNKIIPARRLEIGIIFWSWVFVTKVVVTTNNHYFFFPNPCETFLIIVITRPVFSGFATLLLCTDPPLLLPWALCTTLSLLWWNLTLPVCLLSRPYTLWLWLRNGAALLAWCSDPLSPPMLWLRRGAGSLPLWRRISMTLSLLACFTTLTFCWAWGLLPLLN